MATEIVGKYENNIGSFVWAEYLCVRKIRRQGFEPRLLVPETNVLPLDDLRIHKS